MLSTSSDPNGSPSRADGGAARRGVGGGKGRALASGAAALALGLWIAVSAFHPFTPTLPQPGLDASWVAAMGEAADRSLRWGIDVAFTYGPASTLVTAYYNDAYLGVTLPVLLATCLLFGCCLVLLVQVGDLVRRAPLALPAALPAAVSATGLVAAFAAGNSDGFFLVLPLLPFLLVLAPGRVPRIAVVTAAVTAVAVGLIGMAKMSFPLAALPLFVLGDAAAVVRRRLPLLTPACVLGFVLGDLVYGQSLADLPAFIRQQGETVAGYSEAMALDGSRREIAAYLAATLLLLGLSAAVEWTRRPVGSGARCAVPFGLAWVVLILFKAGFVRQDAHTMIAWYGLALAAIVVAVARVRPGWPRSATTVVVAAVAGSAMLGPWLVASQTGRVADAVVEEGRALALAPALQLASAWELIRDPAAFAAARRAEKAERWRDLAEDAPLPHLAGGVDVIPSQQSRLLASGLDYRPRPSFQEYSTYTAGLVAANRAFMAGPHAPDWVLFGPESPLGIMTLDPRYPNLAEGGLWLDLLRLYRPERRIGELVALRRRATPGALVLGDPRRITVGLGEVAAVESGATGAVFVRIDVHPTLLGRAVAVLFRPAPLIMTVSFADGQRRPYGLISGIGAAGFVLSPLVTNATDFERLAEGAVAPPERIVTGISVDTPPRLRGLLDSRIEIETRSVSGLSAEAPVPPTSAWSALVDTQDVPAGAATVAAGPPSLLSLPVAGLKHVDLGFGLALASDAPPGAETVCFVVHPADGTARTLWRRCLDRAREADHAPQTLSLAVPPGVSELALGASCQSGCDEGMGAYWGKP